MMTIEEIADYNRTMAQNFYSGPIPPLEEGNRRVLKSVWGGREPTKEEVAKEVDLVNSREEVESS